jgi:hypothetical protein
LLLSGVCLPLTAEEKAPPSGDVDVALALSSMASGLVLASTSLLSLPALGTGDMAMTPRGLTPLRARARLRPTTARALSRLPSSKSSSPSLVSWRAGLRAGLLIFGGRRMTVRSEPYVDCKQLHYVSR